ncbi:hypothetical protein K474DRAFT_1601259 [Panus rudis PR-1116 ss-1]|nr:hypothetical protein K474DRAFT_1601259 [Panus rudis PR-1116 ss-1]
MPKSKRAKLVSLTKVAKKTKEQKGALINEVQENADKWQYCWLFEVGNMRNAHLKTVRKLWKDSARIFFGRGAVMAKALGTGPVMQQHSDPPEPFPHNEEPQLRKLGLHTTMVRGVPTLEAPHKVCEEGKTLTPEQAQLLKLIGVKMVEFRVGLRAYWEATSGIVVQVEGEKVAEGEKPKEGEEVEDAEMSD